MSYNYNIPIVAHNLRREETIVQIADSLQYLTDVANDIFLRINQRIDSNTRTLTSVQDRIKVANSKIEKLSREKKAIQVFSSNKYPAAHLNKKYESVFDSDKIQIKRTKYKYSETINTKEEPEKIENFYVKTNKSSTNYDSKGLGKIPDDTEYFTDILLYNTGKNLYKKYIMIDALETAQLPRYNEQHDKNNIEDAPASLTDQAIVKNAVDDDSFFYSPDLGEVPTLQVPLDLPDLPGIADDLRYETENNSFGIAPSVSISTLNESKSTLNLTNLSNNTTPTDLKIENTEVSAQKNNSTETQKPVEQIIYQETKQNEIEVKPNLSSVISKQKIDSEIVHDDVPSEPEVKIPQKEKSEVITDNKNKQDFKMETNNAHATLMEAIRKAGGVKNAQLRSTSQTETEKSTSKSGGDLMADLHAKLSLRRKGISGTKNVENLDANSTFAKISNLIPLPPLSSSEGEKEDTEDDDWED